MLTRRVALWSAALACAFAVTACGGGDSTPKAWDAKAVADVRAAAASVKTKLPGECTDVAVADHDTYVANAKQLGGAMPRAVATCQVSGEAIEISAFADAGARDAFLTDRTKRVCDASSGTRARSHGLRWVVDGDWSMQPDTQAVGERLATALGATYRPIPCEGEVLDWSAKDVTQVRRLAQQLHDGSFGCDDLTLQNRDQLSRDAHYVSVGLPGAYAQCTGADGGRMLVGSYVDTQTLLGDFMPQELSFLCETAKTTQVVVGRDWSVSTGSGTSADAIARALHGEVFGSCRP
jgi:hypothetical protein